jgi:HEAT repeat protein
MIETAPPARPSRPLRLRQGFGGQGRRKWLIVIAATLAVLFGAAVVWYAHMRSPAGRAEAILEQVRQQVSGQTSFTDRIRKLVGLGVPDAAIENPAMALAELGPQAVPVLIDALKDPAARIHECALNALILMEEPAAAEALCGIVLGKDPDDRRSLAMNALVYMRDGRAVPILKGWLENHNAVISEAYAAGCLGKIGGPEARAALEVAVRDDSRPVRQNAAEGLGEIGDPASVLALLPLLGDPDPYVAGAAARALGDIGDRSAVPALLEAAKGDVLDLRQGVVLALGKIGGPAALPLIQEVASGKEGGRLGKANSSKEGEPQETALEVLGQMGGPEALPMLKTALKNPRAGTRCAAVNGIGRLGGPEALPLLLKALEDPDSEVCRAAARQLGYLPGTGPDFGGDAKAVEGLLAATSHKAWTVRRAAIDSLAAIDSPEVEEAVVRLLKDPADDVKMAAAVVCGAKRRPEALPVFRALLKTDIEAYTFQCIVGLGALGTPEARQILQEEVVTKTRFFYLRKMAAGVLKDGLEPHLIAQTRSNRFQVASWAVECVRRLNTPAMIFALEEALKTVPAESRAEAARVIDHLRRMETTRSKL